MSNSSSGDLLPSSLCGYGMHMGDTHNKNKGKKSRLTAPETWVPTELLAMSQGVECDGFSTFDVPIFTEEFLDQNKGEVLAGAGVLVAGRLESGGRGQGRMGNRGRMGPDWRRWEWG